MLGVVGSMSLNADYIVRVFIFIPDQDASFIEAPSDGVTWKRQLMPVDQ